MDFFDPSWIVSATSETLTNPTVIIIYVCTHAIAFVQSFGKIGEPPSFSRRAGPRVSLPAVFKLPCSSARTCFARRPERPDCRLSGLGRVLNHCFSDFLMSLALNGCHAGSVPVVMPAGRLTGASTLDGENETPHGLGPVGWLSRLDESIGLSL